nr:zinc finger, CCHC-type [Tanacetum cinerariifolium]
MWYQELGSKFTKLGRLCGKLLLIGFDSKVFFKSDSTQGAVEFRVLELHKALKVFLVDCTTEFTTKGFFVVSVFCAAGLGVRSSIKGFLKGFRLSRFRDKGLATSLKELPVATIVAYDNVILKKAYNALILCFDDWVLWEITKGTIVDTLQLKEVFKALNSRELQNMTEAKGDGSEGLYVGFEADGYDSADVMIAMSVEQLFDCIMDLRGSYHMKYKRDHFFDFEEYNGGNILLGDGKERRVRGTGKIQVQKRDVSSFVLDNVGSTQQCMKSGIAKHLGVVEIQQQNELAKKTNMTLLAKRTCIKQGMLEPVKVKCIFIECREGIVGNKLRRLDDVTSNVALYRNMGFNKSGKYKNTFIGSGVGRWFIGSTNSGFDGLLFKDMDARPVVYVLDNDCRKSSYDNEGYYWEHTPDEAEDNILGMKIIRDQC